ncbi:GDP-mannose 4,6-dehydratase, partial [Ferroplasma sp.]|uniref:GDP-mannose 4,6-dehydratase n=1 Tax=Ferroplasma sp. TaxID=2591003 RepID=UPI0026066591
MKSALITGITGQDGAYLAKLLLKKNYKVYGLYRRLSTPNFWRLQSLGIYDKINLISGDLSDLSSILNAFKASDPDEVYHLAAQSFVEASFESPLATAEVTGLSTTRILEAVKLYHKDTRVYYAGTSEMFGSSYADKALNEMDVFQPMSPYAAAKLYGYWISRIYREGYGLFISSGILFNHESEIRGLEFVTRKIVNEVAKIHYGLEQKIKLGNINAKRDWGYAPEYVDAMHRMLQSDKA